MMWNSRGPCRRALVPILVTDTEVGARDRQFPIEARRRTRLAHADGTVIVCVLPLSVSTPVASKCPAAPGLMDVEMNVAVG